MKYNKDIHKRKSLRLDGYDYSQNGLYFITIGINGKLNLLGKINNGENILNLGGKIIQNYWTELVSKYRFIKLHEYVIMPNHFHGIIEIRNTNNRAPTRGAPTDHIEMNNENKNINVGVPLVGAQNQVQNIKYLGEIIGEFKSLSTNAYIKQVHLGACEPFDKKLWQKNYYEHIIRDENSYKQISEYIINNPKNWENDELY